MKEPSKGKDCTKTVSTSQHFKWVSHGPKEKMHPNNTTFTHLPSSSMHTVMKANCIENLSGGLSSFNSLNNGTYIKLVHEEEYFKQESLPLENCVSHIYSHGRSDQGRVKGNETVELSMGDMVDSGPAKECFSNYGSSKNQPPCFVRLKLVEVDSGPLQNSSHVKVDILTRS
ncbi:unnamed protein product [Lupinus luteus]|uniref:Uncharacterized protein n=1 Tax=Lupinus luteus TaxID=3873 RepID=A0AAV1XAZ4_LUPLU